MRNNRKKGTQFQFCNCSRLVGAETNQDLYDIFTLIDKKQFFYLLALACLLLINKTLFIRQSRMLQFLHLLTPKVLNSFLAASVEITNVVTFSKRYLFDLCNKYTTDDLIKMRKSCPTLQLFIRCERWR